MTEKSETSAEATEAYVSDQLAVKTWSVIARDLHEGGSIVMLHKAWDSKDQEVIIFPSYAGQDPDAIKPNTWMSWRHELKPPKEGHTRISDYAEIVETIPIQSAGALAAIDREHTLTRVEAARRFHLGEPGLVALVLRVYQLPRTYKFKNVAENEGDALLVPLPFDVDFEGALPAVPAVDDDDFERRRAALKASLS